MTLPSLDPIISAWMDPAAVAVERLSGGLINQTYRLTDSSGTRHILQRVNPIFGPGVSQDIQAVTAALARTGLVTPHLVPTRGGELHLERDDDERWRMLTHVEGVTFERPAGSAQVESAGELLGRFHAALVDLEHEFQSVRPGVHDTARHLKNLEQALRDHADHRLYGGVELLARELLERAVALPKVGTLPQRVVHGDPKLANILFAGPEPPQRDRARCLVDLDTCGRMAIHLELGDAFRSWCNPAGEDERGHFSLALFRAAWSGYRSTGPALSEQERVACATGVDWITLELTARFLADALQESYFGHDAERFPAAGEHNLARARSQWALHVDAEASRPDRQRIVTAG